MDGGRFSAPLTILTHAVHDMLHPTHVLVRYVTIGVVPVLSYSWSLGDLAK